MHQCLCTQRVCIFVCLICPSALKQRASISVSTLYSLPLRKYVRIHHLPINNAYLLVVVNVLCPLSFIFQIPQSPSRNPEPPACKSQPKSKPPPAKTKPQVKSKGKSKSRRKNAAPTKPAQNTLPTMPPFDFETYLREKDNRNFQLLIDQPEKCHIRGAGGGGGGDEGSTTAPYMLIAVKSIAADFDKRQVDYPKVYYRNMSNQYVTCPITLDFSLGGASDMG